MSEVPTWIAALADPGIQADVLSYCANESLSLSAAIHILSDIANRGTVTAAELLSLQSIAAALNGNLTASSYVKSVFDQLVLGSPMNSTWTGGASFPVALGNLHIGTTPSQLNELIGKWFLGTDLPNPVLPQNFDGLGASAVYPQYKALALPLYGPAGLPSANDVNQGELGDCVVCATMIDLVVNHPNMLGSMIVNNGNGTYGVRFYLQGTADWVTVNDQMPVNSSGTLVFNNANTTNNSLWVDLIEKAYAQLSASGQLGHPAVNAYNNINGNNASFVLPAFTGTAVSFYSSWSLTWAADKQIFIHDLAIGDDILLSDPEPAGFNTTDSLGKVQLVGNHAFAMIGYDSATGNFILRNPWGTLGSGTTQKFDTQFEVSMDQIAAVGGLIYVDNAANLPVAPFTVVGALAAQQSGTLVGAPAIADSAADVVGNLDRLQGLASAGQLGTITLTDGGALTLTIAPAQLSLDAQALAQIAGPYTLAFSGALTVAEAQGLAASAAEKLVAAFSVADNAANISANLDALQALAAAGKLSSITLTDLDTPVLTVTAAQQVADAMALGEIAGAYLLNGSQPILPQAGSGNLAVVEITADPALGPTNVRFADNQGGIVGFFGSSNLNYQGFIWNGVNPTGFTALPPLSGDVASVAKMDDVAGTVVGYSTSNTGASTPVWWQGQGGGATALPLNSGFTGGTALAINGAGDIAGSETNATGHSIVIWKAGVPLQVGANPGAVSDTTFAINASDGLAGMATFLTLGISPTKAYTYQNGHLSLLAALPGDSSSGAYGINNANQVVGFSLGATEHAVLWQNGQVVKLATLAPTDQSFANAIDNSGAIVGYDSSLQSQQAVIWVNGIVYDLNALIPANSGWTLQTARSVSDVDHGCVLVTGSGVLSGTAESYALQIPVTNLSTTATAACQGYQTGLMTSAAQITDSAANIFANLDSLEAMATGGRLAGISLTDSGPLSLWVTATQLTKDAAALGAITGPVAFSESAAAANVTISGLGGHANMVFFSGASGQYDIKGTGDGIGFTMTDTGTGRTSVDHLSNITQVHFTDKTMTIAGNGSMNEYVALLYQGALGRTPDAPGLAAWQQFAATLPAAAQAEGADGLWDPAGYNGVASIAADFVNSTEFQTRYGSLSNSQFITQLYTNVLDRQPDAAGLNAWVTAMNNGVTQAQALVGLADSAEAISNAAAGFSGLKGVHAAWLFLI